MLWTVLDKRIIHKPHSCEVGCCLTLCGEYPSSYAFCHHPLKNDKGGPTLQVPKPARLPSAAYKCTEIPDAIPSSFRAQS